MRERYSLMIHGGAGLIADKGKYQSAVLEIVGVGEKMLSEGVSALDTVEHCVTLLENNPLFNAGKGSVLNEEGEVEMDAAIMNGENLKAGSVAGITHIKNPISLARAVMEKSEHVMLIGTGAKKFAAVNQIEKESSEYFIIPDRVRQWEESKKQNKVVLDHSGSNSEKKFGTVGAVAKDKNGNLAAATSTGGIVNKKFGRVGDTPIIGAGVYADNETCAVSATGFGEQFIRTVLSKTISDIIFYEKISAQEAAQNGIEYLVRKVQGLGGVIVIDRDGNCGSAFSTPAMIRAQVSEGKDITFLLD
jgi:L-asparaginase / beta-aspartyl-peptidase